jgi:hypothetical protein
MKSALRAALQLELESACHNEVAGDIAAAFAHLERAHILSQHFTLAHAGVHMRMLRLGWQQRDARQVLGQVTRILAALLFSRFWVPSGNTGGANVSALRPMPLPADLKALLEPGDA